MTKKNFELDDELAVEFKRFCQERGLGESISIASAILHFMEESAESRETQVLRLNRWMAGDREISGATTRGRGRSGGAA